MRGNTSVIWKTQGILFCLSCGYPGSVAVMMAGIFRWKAEDEMLLKRVSAEEHLWSVWSAYENEHGEAETSVNKLEMQLDAVIADTEPEHVHTCLEQLQVWSQQCTHCTNSRSNGFFLGHLI